jgi:hypothetical protein
MLTELRRAIHCAIAGHGKRTGTLEVAADAHSEFYTEHCVRCGAITLEDWRPLTDLGRRVLRATSGVAIPFRHATTLIARVDPGLDLPGQCDAMSR